MGLKLLCQAPRRQEEAGACACCGLDLCSILPEQKELCPGAAAAARAAPLPAALAGLGGGRAGAPREEQDLRVATNSMCDIVG